MIVDNNLVWWTGVVEDRDDPEKLGRCKVRVFGYHTADTALLPTSDLPWAIPLQSITSAATSGIGHTPVGIVPGTWVMGWFLDGDEAQRPLILGTLAGRPLTPDAALAKKKQNDTLRGIAKAADGNPLVDQNNTLIQSKLYVEDERNSLVPLKAQDVNKLFEALATKLSNNDYTKVGDNGNLGKYQISISTLIDLGYVSRPLDDNISVTWADDSTNWTNFNGIKSKTEFIESQAIQETVMFQYTKNNYDTLLRLGKISEKDDYKVVGALLASAHVMGVKNADKLNKKDDNGIRGKEYFIIGNSALGGETDDVVVLTDDAGNYLPSVNAMDNTVPLNNEELKNLQGFQDPNKKYPKFEYAGLSDINKLATGDVSHTSFKIKENKKIDRISLAGTTQTWDEPAPAYGAGYPYNQVMETEAGHVIELDSTPGAERIQVFHKSGTYIEIDVNGTMVRKTVGENYEIMDRNNFTYVKGAHCLTVEGKTSILVKDNAQIEVEGDLSVTGHGETNITTASSASISAENIVLSATNSLTAVSEGSINLQGKDINLYAKGGAITQKSSKDISLESGTLYNISLKGGLALLFDAGLVKTKMGANRIREIAFSILSLPKKMIPDTNPIPVLQREIISKANYLYDSGEPGSSEYKSALEKLGLINSSIQSKPSAADTSAPNVSGYPAIPIIQSDVSEINQFKYFPRSFVLSNKDNRIFTLGDMLQDGGLVAQRGLTEQQIVYNLRQLIVNCLDPIKAKYPDMHINSGFRPGTNLSDHGLGAAADIKFTNRSKTEYKDIADWIVKNVPHRQVLLEYVFETGSNKLRSTWIHIALLTENGNLVKSNYSPVQTFVNHTAIYSKLVNLA